MLDFQKRYVSFGGTAYVASGDPYSALQIAPKLALYFSLEHAPVLVDEAAEANRQGFVWEAKTVLVAISLWVCAEDALGAGSADARAVVARIQRVTS